MFTARVQNSIWPPKPEMFYGAAFSLNSMYTLIGGYKVEAQSGKANKILGYVKRTSNSIKSIDTKRTIYLTIVRAHLAYSSPVWAPQTVDNIKNIERIQRRATKYILGLSYRCRDTYKDRLLETDLIPLTYWHENSDMDPCSK